jgi:spermidine/putrescine transport system substrate-binding protein
MILLKKISFLLAVLMLVTLLPGCGDSDKVVLNVYNWGEYIDESVLDDFMVKYPHIKVKYEIYSDNEVMYTKIKNNTTSYDILIPSDYMIARLIEEDMLAKLDFANIPNYKYIDDAYKNLDFDPNNEYSVPYMWGVLGILYDTTKVREGNFNWNTLFKPEYNKEVLMKNDIRDSLGIALKSLGYSVNSTNKAELEAAKQKLISLKPNVLGYVGDEGMDKMIAGEAALAVMYSGDAVNCIEQNPNLDFAIPTDGTNLFFDSMVVPKNSKHKAEAELFINFMCETDTAVKNVEEIYYSTPHTEAKEALPDDIKNSFAYPSKEILDKAEVYSYLGEHTELYDRMWTEFKASL